MLTDETAKSLAAAMNRLAEAIEKLGAPGLQPGGIRRLIPGDRASGGRAV